MSDDKYYEEIAETQRMNPIAKLIYEWSHRTRELEYALLLMVYQYCVDNNALSHSFMCAGETAFRALGITLNTPVSEIERRIDELESDGY